MIELIGELQFVERPKYYASSSDGLNKKILDGKVSSEIPRWCWRSFVIERHVRPKTNNIKLEI